MIRRIGLLVTGLLCVLLSAACVSLPEDGSIRAGSATATGSTDAGFPYDPRPPQSGETPIEIVRHFLDAMLATPTSTVVAKQFLSTTARAEWRPERQMITYEDFETPEGDDEVTLALTNAHHLDAGGRWRGALSEQASTVRFTMTTEGGEWRIGDLPDATIVSDEFFASRYQQVSLYFFDPTGEILVPEPAFVPRGGQLASALVRGLLQGTDPRLRDVAESFIPEGMSLDLSVPVSADGVATVSLRGDDGVLDADAVEQMAVQFAWTLRQDPAVRRLRILINDTPVALEDAPTVFDVDIGADHDPAEAYAWPDPFALRNGRLVSVAGEVEGRTDGPFGTSTLGLRSVAVDLEGARGVAVSTDGRSLLEAPVERTQGQGARTLLSGATDLLRPAWDHADRIWLVDRAAGGARVSVVIDGTNTRVRVPGISGADVSSYIVSRDGSRLAAVVSTPDGDVVMLSRLAGAGERPRATEAVRISPDTPEPVRINDIAWQSPTRILAVGPVARGISQVSSFPVDGSPATSGVRRAEGVVRQDIVELVASPVAETDVWGVSANGRVHDLSGERGAALPEPG
ncbi:MAG TPA: LpqB family beta-propeller domain-containing protein, partial [Nocardioides sp.]